MMNWSDLTKSVKQDNTEALSGLVPKFIKNLWSDKSSKSEKASVDIVHTKAEERRVSTSSRQSTAGASLRSSAESFKAGSSAFFKGAFAVASRTAGLAITNARSRLCERFNSSSDQEALPAEAQHLPEESQMNTDGKVKPLKGLSNDYNQWYELKQNQMSESLVKLKERSALTKNEWRAEAARLTDQIADLKTPQTNFSNNENASREAMGMRFEKILNEERETIRTDILANKTVYKEDKNSNEKNTFVPGSSRLKPSVAPASVLYRAGANAPKSVEEAKPAEDVVDKAAQAKEESIKDNLNYFLDDMCKEAVAKMIGSQKPSSTQITELESSIQSAKKYLNDLKDLNRSENPRHHANASFIAEKEKEIQQYEFELDFNKQKQGRII